MAHPFVAGERRAGLGRARDPSALGASRRGVRAARSSPRPARARRPAGFGASIVAIEDLALQPVAIPGRLPIHEIAFDPEDAARSSIPSSARRRRAPQPLPRPRRSRARDLGAAEGALDLALAHASTRVQFGKPIGSFQAVRHLLAWARTDCAAVLEVSRQAGSLDLAAPPHFDEIAKALAGRNGRRACERALQVLGGIGFTAEHDHHHFHSRVLALDACSARRPSSRAASARGYARTRTDPEIPRQLLHRGANV
jgi:hypothetical protein